tara:strand:+ start:2490 stop:5237 length:2748 start_codon:yes stop_codon:yes gene_type:complete
MNHSSLPEKEKSPTVGAVGLLQNHSSGKLSEINYKSANGSITGSEDQGIGRTQIVGPPQQRGTATTAPPDLSSMVVSTFVNARTITPVDRPIFEVFTEIRDGTYRHPIESIREANSGGEIETAKRLKKSLPGFTPSGKFRHRDKDNLIAPSFLIVADIDDLNEIELKTARAKVAADPHTLSSFVSPSGRGLKIIYRIPEGRSHTDAFFDMGAHVLSLTGLKVDKAGKDVCRLCFVSWDPELTINPGATPLPVCSDQPHCRPVGADAWKVIDQAEKPDIETGRALLACITTRPDYMDWLRISSAVWDGLGEDDGSRILDEWSPEESPNEYKQKFKQRLTEIHFGTLFHIAEQYESVKVSRIKCFEWFSAEAWDEAFVEKWRARLMENDNTPPSTIAFQLLNDLKEVMSSATVGKARHQLVLIAANAQTTEFERDDLKKIAKDLLDVSSRAFESALKNQGELKKEQRGEKAIAEMNGESGTNPLYFDGNSYWRREYDEAFGKLAREDARLHLNKAGLSKRGDPSPCDSKLYHLQRENRVTYAGPLCGRKAGLHHENGVRVLVTRSPIWIEGAVGSWDTVNQTVSNLFGEAAGDPLVTKQRDVFYAWLKIARGAIRSPETHLPGQVLALVGPANCGKSFLQSKIITPALGGRVADPSLFFIGQSNFNAELWEAEHLALGDKALELDGKQRIALRNELKRVVAEPVYPLHAKHRDAMTLKPIWRVTISANEDPDSAAHLPTLEGSFEDKITYLKCYAPPRPFFDPRVPNSRKAFADNICRELPAFLAFVDSFDIPTDLLNERFGVAEFHHPKIMELLGEGDPLRHFEEVFENWIQSWPVDLDEREESTTNLFAYLDESTSGGLVRLKICSGAPQLGHLLNQISSKPQWAGRLRRTWARTGGREKNTKIACWHIYRDDLM